MKHSTLRVLAGLIIVLVLAFSANPPDGRTGAPGDGLCSDCHSSGSQSGNVMITGVPTDIVPGQTYSINVISTTATNSVLGGFQMVALHNDGNVNAGAMSNPSASSTVTAAGNGRTYHEHQPAQGFGGGTMVSWSVDWTAPMTGPDGNITFYAASVLANGNGSNGGDGVVTTNEAGLFMGLPPLTASITNPMDVSCNGDNDGSATAGGNGGVTPYSFLWSNGEMNATAIMLTAGTQSVTITDDFGQMATASVVIGEPDVIVANTSVTNNITCNGDNDGSASSSPSGGTGAYAYLWSNGSTTMSSSGLTPGSHFVTVTDVNDCETIGEVIISEPAVLTLDLIIQTDISCFGFNDGMATVSGSGGTMPFTYSWSNGQAGATANNLNPGLQTVTVTDANNCIQDLDVIILEPDELILSLVTQSNVNCFNGNDGSATVSAVGGTGAYNFQWSNGQTGPTANNLTAASYTCMVTDVNGCLDMIAVNISQPLEIMIDLMITHESGPGANDGVITANAAGGTSPYTYEWSNGGTGPTIMNLMPGNYTVEVTDNNGCVKTATGAVSGSGCTLEASIIVIQDLTCPDDSVGILTYTATEDVATILWSTGETSDTIAGLPASSYSLTVTGSDGCEAMASVMLDANDTQSPSYVVDTLCLFLDSDGMATLDSMTFYDNLIDNCDPNPMAMFDEVNVDCSDEGITSIDVVLRDASGNINAMTLVLIIIDTIAPTISCPIDITVNTCDTITYPMPSANDNCANAVVELMSGIGSGNIFPVGTTTETYRAIDQTGNQVMCSFNITVISDLASDVTTTEATCSDATDGAAVITATGGTAPYSFQINPSGDITMLAPGSYVALIQDDANCTVIDSFEIGAPDAIQIDTILIVDATQGNFDGSIELNVSGGTSPYSFLWLRDTAMYSMNEDIFNLFSGYYSVMITDASGCEFSLDSIFVDGLVAITNTNAQEIQIKIYEFDRVINIVPVQDIGMFDVELYDGNGRFIASKSNNLLRAGLPIKEVAAGFYIVRVKSRTYGTRSQGLIVK